MLPTKWKTYALAFAVGAFLFWGARAWLAVDRKQQYDAGHAAATTEQALKTAEVIAEFRQRERDQQNKAEERYAEQQQAIDAAVADRDAAVSVADGLRLAVETQRTRAAEDAQRAGRNVAQAERPWKLLESCRKEYAGLVDHVERLNADFRKAQSWASVIDPEGARRYGYSAK